jgi:hypothetical protein
VLGIMRTTSSDVQPGLRTAASASRQVGSHCRVTRSEV